MRQPSVDVSAPVPPPEAGIASTVMAFSSAYHDSDADDEYERSIMTSPILATDDETSPTDSDPPSTEPTPTTFGHGMDHFKQLSPANTIAAWTPSQCAEFISSLGMPREYCDKFLGTSEARDDGG